jgi:hypothetical protein
MREGCVAHSATNVDTNVGLPATVTTSSWAPGKTALFTVTSRLLVGLPAGHYALQALLTPVPALTESSTADNRVTTNGTGDDVELNVTV